VSRNTKILITIVAVVLVVGLSGAAYAQFGGSSSKKKDLIILADVKRRTLQDKVTITGTLSREEQRKVTAVTTGRVSALYAKDGQPARAGESLFALDGRDAIAERGSISFFRTLTIGDRGDDVLQLKEILANEGFNPGPIDTLFNEQTQFALAQWQALHHYPGATPVSPQPVTVSLQPSNGYTVGPQSSAGLIIGPVATRAATSGTGTAILTSDRTPQPAISGPVLTIQSSAAVVSEGQPATFVITSSQASASAIDVNIATSGTATSADIVTPPSVVTLPANARTAQVVVATRVDNLVKPDKTLRLTLSGGSGYSVGSPNHADTKIVDNNVPQLHVSGGGTVTAGDTSTITLTADQAPIKDTQVNLTLTGDAVPVTDYQSVSPNITLRAGTTNASLTIQTLAHAAIQPDRHIVVTLAPGPGYNLASPSSATILIAGDKGDAARPLVTLTSAVQHLAKGQSYPVTISLSRATTVPLTIALTYGGTAQDGVDFTPPGGSIVVPAGQTSLTISVPTVQDNVVETDRVLVVSVASASGYRVGSPSAASVVIESQVIPELQIKVGAPLIPAGGAAAFVIYADQAPVKDTSVQYQVVSSGQGAGQLGGGPSVPPFLPLTGTATLPAGQTQVTVILRTIQTDVVFQPTDMIVGSWPIRIGQIFVKEGDPVTPGEPILSLTDPNFTVTLQASATDRTKLAVGQHCTVKLTGGDTEVDGTISELDQNTTTLDAATPGGTPQQVYEGKISVADLGAADGASVSIDVVDQQRTNVLTVPIAAVKQNGSGQDVVRVIDLSKGGHVTEVQVKTGLTEGSYIEVMSGLKGDETVIVEVDQPK